MRKETVSLLLALACSLLVGAGQLFAKAGTERVRHLGWQDPTGLALFLVSYSFLGVALVVFLIALRGGALSVLYPVLAARYVWLVALAPFFFATESLNLYKLVGATLTAVGVMLVARQGAR